MKKIIAAFDGLKFSESTLRHAIQLGIQHEAHLVGVFLDDYTFNSHTIYKAYSGNDFSEKTLQELTEEDQAARDEAVLKFESACQQACLNYSVHREKHIALHDLLHESIYADLLLIDANETMTHFTESPPSRFVRELLARVECPVWLTPRHYAPVKKVALLYDGAPASVHAIKMFSYMLPVLSVLPVEVLTVKPPDADLHLPDNKLMKEFMKRHYPDATYTVYKGDPETMITEHLRKVGEQVLVVLGAYQRSNISRWFRSSMADVLARELQWPLFIAHK